MTPQEIQKYFEEIKTHMSDFRKDNDARLSAIEKKGGVDPLLIEKIERQEKAITSLEQKLEQAQTAMQRISVVADAKQESVENAKKMADIFARFAKGGDQAISAEEKKFYVEQVKTLSVGSEPDGGFFVRPEISTQITQKVFETSPLRQLATVLTIGSDAFEEAYDESEVTTENGGEGSTIGATGTSQFNMIRIPVHQMQAKPKITLQLLDDSALNLEAYLSQKVQDKFGRDEATDFISGTGNGESRGILSYTAGDGFNKVEQVAGSTGPALYADDLISLQNALLEPFQANAMWLMRRATISAARQLKDSQGRYLLDLQGNLAEGYTNVILGRPVKVASDMPAVASNALAVAYGDFKVGYLIVDRVGMSVLRDPYSTDNHVVFKFRKRTGGGVRHFQAIKLLKIHA